MRVGSLFKNTNLKSAREHASSSTVRVYTLGDGYILCHEEEVSSVGEVRDKLPRVREASVMVQVEPPEGAWLTEGEYLVDYVEPRVVALETSVSALEAIIVEKDNEIEQLKAELAKRTNILESLQRGLS